LAPMKAVRPVAAIIPALSAALFLLALTGCGNFWEPPGGNGSTGTTPTTTTLSPATTAATVGMADELTASVAPTTGTGTVSGTVIFESNGSSIGTETLSSGTTSDSYAWSAAATYSVTANYQGNSTYASSQSSAASITVTAASSSSSRTGIFNPATASRATTLVLDAANTWTVPASVHLHNVAVVVLRNGMVQNIDGGGHCVFYSGQVFFAKDSENPSSDSDSPGVYELSGGGYLAPEGTRDLNCE
jgi:hypothetical protein